MLRFVLISCIATLACARPEPPVQSGYQYNRPAPQQIGGGSIGFGGGGLGAGSSNIGFGGGGLGAGSSNIGFGVGVGGGGSSFGAGV